MGFFCLFVFLPNHVSCRILGPRHGFNQTQAHGSESTKS